MRRVISVDGPAGVGKGTLCQRLARELGWAYLDSGVFYRLLGREALRLGAGDGDLPLPALLDFLATAAIEFRLHEGGYELRVNEAAVGAEIRTETVAALSSQLAAREEIRTALLHKFRAFAPGQNLVADGRDMGTVVFPEARPKIFLTATAEIRAQRRWQQLKAQGENANINKLVDEIRQRDERDQNRTVAPLKPASDAVLIDTSALSIDAVFQQVLGLI